MNRLINCLIFKKLISYFSKLFGCLCYPFLRSYNKIELDFRSQPCVIVGYSSKHKGYLCFHPSTDRVYIVKHVVFDETIFPYPSMVKVISRACKASLLPVFTSLLHAASMSIPDSSKFATPNMSSVSIDVSLDVSQSSPSTSHPLDTTNADLHHSICTLSTPSAYSPDHMPTEPVFLLHQYLLARLIFNHIPLPFTLWLLVLIPNL